jgi:hypothetical protein
VKVPRAGGLPELLAAGEVDAVIVESIDRFSRMTADGTRIERLLEERDVALFAADEPLDSNATAILTRRVKQGVAEWYVRDLIETPNTPATTSGTATTPAAVTRSCIRPSSGYGAPARPMRRSSAASVFDAVEERSRRNAAPPTRTRPRST